MSSLSPRLKALERRLDALGGEAMMLSELDGLLTGLIVCPDLIMPHEWLPLVWGDEEDVEELVFDSQSQAQARRPSAANRPAITWLVAMRSTVLAPREAF